MKIPFRLAPHIYSTVNNRTVMVDVLLVLFALYGMAYFTYGPRSIILAAISVLTCLFWDSLGLLISKKKFTSPDLSSVVTGLLIPLMLSASISYQAIVVAATFAIAVVKLPYGGVGSNIFNPAASGVAFAIIAFSSQALTYPAPYQTLPITSVIDVPVYSGLSYTLWIDGLPDATFNDILLGAVPGPMGTTNVLVLSACMLFLIAKRSILITQPLMSIAVIAIAFYIFPRSNVDSITSVWLELAAMPTLFYVTFIACDPVTTPTRRLAKAAYAACLGLFIVIFRHYNRHELIEPIVIILMNALTPIFEMGSERLARNIRSESFAIGKNYKQAVFEQEEDSDDT